MRAKNRLKLAAVIALLTVLAGSEAVEAPTHPGASHTRLEPVVEKSWDGLRAQAIYTTSKKTPFVGSPSGTPLKLVPRGYTLGSESARTAKGFTQVTYQGRLGWISTKDLGKPKAGSAWGAGKSSYTDREYRQAVGEHINRWCPGVVIVVGDHDRFYATNDPLMIHFGRQWENDPTTASVRAIALHECAHIIQFSTYRLDESLYSALYSPVFREATEKLNPRADGQGIEYLADCMSELMGATRHGTDHNGRNYEVGYGLACTKDLYDAARTILGGRKLPGYQSWPERKLSEWTNSGTGTPQ